MNILNRLKRLEQTSAPISKTTSEPETCEHPMSMFKLYKTYPAKGYSDQRLVTKGHCDVCGFDDYLWSFYALTEEQEYHRQGLGFWERMSYELKLIERGLISYAVFPPPPEVQIRFTGRVIA